METEQGQMIIESPNYTILPLDSRNQESVRIPGFWNPMVRWCNWDFLWSKIEPHTVRAFVPTGLYFLLPVILINIQVLTVSGGMIVLWLNRVYLETRGLNPRISIFDQRKSQLHHFTIGFQKPGIWTDSWFLESKGTVQLGFSLINRKPTNHVVGVWDRGKSTNRMSVVCCETPRGLLGQHVNNGVYECVSYGIHAYRVP